MFCKATTPHSPALPTAQSSGTHQSLLPTLPGDDVEISAVRGLENLR